MPATPEPLDDGLSRSIAAPAWAVAKLAQQQNKTIVNPQGQPIINEGLVPGSSPAAYGWQFVDPSTGTQRMFVGEDASGTYVAFYDGSGTMLSKYDTAGFHFYNAGTEVARLDAQGFHEYDASSNERARLGVTTNGDYGLQVLDTSGHSQEILPLVEQYVDTLITVTSTSYVSSSGPSVTVVVGASGAVVVEASCFISPPATTGTHISQQGNVGLFLDGSLYNQILTVQVGSNSATPGILCATNASTKRIISGLTVGSHSFELKYEDKTGDGSQFAARSLIVTPI